MKTIEQFGLLTGYGQRIVITETRKGSKINPAVQSVKPAEFDPSWNDRIAACIARVFRCPPEGIEPPLFPANQTACVI